MRLAAVWYFLAHVPADCRINYLVSSCLSLRVTCLLTASTSGKCLPVLVPTKRGAGRIVGAQLRRKMGLFSCIAWVSMFSRNGISSSGNARCRCHVQSPRGQLEEETPFLPGNSTCPCQARTDWLEREPKIRIRLLDQCHPVCLFRSSYVLYSTLGPVTTLLCPSRQEPCTCPRYLSRLPGTLILYVHATRK